MQHIAQIPGYVKPLGPYSHAVAANGFVFISAQTPLKAGGRAGEFVGATVEEQTRQVLRNIEAILKELGGSLEDVVRTTVYLANPADFAKMNEAYGAFFPRDPPARSPARLGTEMPGLLVAIDAIAVLTPTTGA